MTIYAVPKDLDIHHYYKNAFQLTLEVKDEDGRVYDLTGYTAVFALRSTRDSLVNTFTIDGVVDIATGRITFTRTTEDMESLAIGKYYWDVALTASDITRYDLGGEFIQTSKTKQGSSSTVTVRYTSTPILRLTVSTVPVSFSGLAVYAGTTAERTALGATLTAIDKVLFIDQSRNRFYVWRGDTLTWI
jgi:hypothetical protein